jgi:hypothetical protein
MRMLSEKEMNVVAGGMEAIDGGYLFDDGEGDDGGGGGGGGCGGGGAESCGPSMGDIVGGLVGVAAGVATAEMGFTGLLVSGAVAYAAGKMRVDPNANNSAAYYRVPNKT